MKNQDYQVYFPKSYKIQKSSFQTNPQLHLLVLDFSCSDIKKTMKKVLIFCAIGNNESLMTYFRLTQNYSDPHFAGWFSTIRRKRIFWSRSTLWLIAMFYWSKSSKMDLNWTMFIALIPGTEMIFQKYGTWNKTEKIVDERKWKVLCKTRTNLRGRTLITSHVQCFQNYRFPKTETKPKQISNFDRKPKRKSKLSYFFVLI